MNDLTRKMIAGACSNSDRLTFCGQPVNGNKPISAGQQVGCMNFGRFTPGKNGRAKGGCSGKMNPIPHILAHLAAGRVVDVRLMDGYATAHLPK